MQRPAQGVRDVEARLPGPLRPQPPYGRLRVPVVRLEASEQQLAVDTDGLLLRDPGPQYGVLRTCFFLLPQGLVQLAQLQGVLGRRLLCEGRAVGGHRLRRPAQRRQRPSLARPCGAQAGVEAQGGLEVVQGGGRFAALPGQLARPVLPFGLLGRGRRPRRRVRERRLRVLAPALVPVHARRPRQHRRYRRPGTQPLQPLQRPPHRLVVAEAGVGVEQRRVRRPAPRRLAQRRLAPLPGGREVTAGVRECGQRAERLRVPARAHLDRRTQRPFSPGEVGGVRRPPTALHVRRAELRPGLSVTRMGAYERLAVADERRQVGQRGGHPAGHRPFRAGRRTRRRWRVGPVQGQQHQGAAEYRTPRECGDQRAREDTNAGSLHLHGAHSASVRRPDSRTESASQTGFTPMAPGATL